MTPITVLWVGRRAPEVIETLARDYRTRIARHTAFSEVRVRPVEGRGHDPERALAREGETLLGHLKAGDHLIALDEHGRQVSTLELAELVSATGTAPRLVFAIGSDLGLHPAVKQRSRTTLALSRLTLPHQLVRIILLEQVFRALDLLSGGAYHRP